MSLKNKSNSRKKHCLQPIRRRSEHLPGMSDCSKVRCGQELAHSQPTISYKRAFATSCLKNLQKAANVASLMSLRHNPVGTAKAAAQAKQRDRDAEHYFQSASPSSQAIQGSMLPCIHHSEARSVQTLSGLCQVLPCRASWAPSVKDLEP